MKILCVGQEWRGSNSSGMFYALSRIGQITDIVNDMRYVITKAHSPFLKTIFYLLRPLQVQDFNKHLRKKTEVFKPDLIFVYKGTFILPETIKFWKARGLFVVNFFPDVSFHTHGRYIRKCIKLYDHIFTTKTFASTDLKQTFSFPSEKVSFIPHGYDPIIHRCLRRKDNSFFCDASFIGNYSLHKQSYLEDLVSRMPNLNLAIWGGSKWLTLDYSVLKPFIRTNGIFGDGYALAISNSKINIALLSEAVSGASSGDKITSRTFHIPASGGFMLHQMTEEIGEYFEIGKEVDCFNSKEELADKVEYYLKNPSQREKIRVAGYNRVVRDHSLDHRARLVMEVLIRSEHLNSFD